MKRTPPVFARRRRRSHALAALLGLFLGACTVFAGAPTVQELVDQFSPANYLNVVSNKLYTRQGMNRAPSPWGTQHDLCRDAIFDEFQRAGLSPVKDPFSYVDTTNNTLVNVCNIIAVKEGVQNPNNEIYVIGSHYDSRENPGADDNATGIGCQLEMARIFARQHFAKTVVFAIFDSEERWEVGTGKHRLGSLRYVAQHTNDNIRAMVSVDMIGWQAPAPNNNRALICGRTSFNAIRYDLQSAIGAYGDGLTGVLSTSTDNMSDHYSFEQAGIPACCLIEYGYSGNPFYHKPTDYVEQPGYLDWSYLERMCKSVVGYYATQLQPVDVTPRIISLQAGANGSALVQVAGLPRCKYAVEVCTNLVSPTWTTLETNTASATDGTFATLDAQAAVRSGAFYRARFASGYAGVAPVEIILDNPAATVVGSWSTGTSSTDKYGNNYRFASPGAGAAYLEFRPTLATAGNYQVFEWHPQGSNRTTDAPVEIRHSSGAQTVRINQQINGGMWVSLGTFNFAAGTNGSVRIRDNFMTGSVVLADAVKFVLVP